MTLIIGIGNEYRSDDGVGSHVARMLTTQNLPDAKIIELPGEGTELMDAWQGYDRVILIDAVASGGAPGTIHRFDAHEKAIPSRFFNYSTHAFSVAEAVETARALGELPRSVIVYGIEGGNFEQGKGLSDEVSDAARQVFSRILRYMHDLSMPEERNFN